MHVVPEKAGGAPLQTPSALHQAIPACFNFGNIVLGTDCHRAEWPRMSVSHALVIDRHIEEARGARRLAGGVYFLEMAAKRLIPFIEAENCLECRRSRRRLRGVVHECFVQAMTDRALKCLVQDAAPPHTVKPLQLGFELVHVQWSPLLHDRWIEAAELCDVEERPCPFDRGQG